MKLVVKFPAQAMKLPSYRNNHPALWEKPDVDERNSAASTFEHRDPKWTEYWEEECCHRAWKLHKGRLLSRKRAALSRTSKERMSIRDTKRVLEIHTANGVVESRTEARVFIQEFGASVCCILREIM